MIGADIQRLKPPEAGAGGRLTEALGGQGLLFALEAAEPAWWEEKERTLSPTLSSSCQQTSIKTPMFMALG